MPIIDTPKCNLLYSKDAEAGFQPRTIQDDMLCAGFAEGKKDACKVGAVWQAADSALTSTQAKVGCVPTSPSPGVVLGSGRAQEAAFLTPTIQDGQAVSWYTLVNTGGTSRWGPGGRLPGRD